jgi:DNA-binding MarR family transcriptional regulator
MASTLATEHTSNDILRALRRILRKISQHSRQLSREAGLTVPQLLCLRVIGEAEPEEEVTAAMVSQSVQLSPATVSRILDRLEKRQLILRERRSNDRRKVCLSLTEAGRQKVAELPTSLQEQFVTRMQSLPIEEQSQLQGTLERIVDMMEATELDAAPVLDPAVDIKPEAE